MFIRWKRIILLAACLTACSQIVTPVPEEVSITLGPEKTGIISIPTVLATAPVPEETIVSTATAMAITTTVTEKTVIGIDTVDKVERLVSLTGHTDRVTDVAFSPDGAYLASSGWDRKIRLWDTTSWQEVYTINIDSPDINAIAFSPDGKLLATSETIWDVDSGQIVHKLYQSREAGHVAFSPDGTLLAVTGFPAIINLWDVTSGKVMRTFEKQADSLGVFSIMFSPDGNQLAGSGADNGSITLWAVTSGEVSGTFEFGNFTDVHDLEFSPDGSMIAGGGTGYSVRIWDVESGEIYKELSISNGIYGLAFSPDGSILALASCNRVAQLWNVKEGKVLRSLPHADELFAVDFSPDGSMLATGGYDNLVVIWGIPH